MNFKSEHISELCKELLELGINIEPKRLELILHMQEQDYRSHTQVIDPAVEFEHLLSIIRNKKSHTD